MDQDLQVGYPISDLSTQETQCQTPGVYAVVDPDGQAAQLGVQTGEMSDMKAAAIFGGFNMFHVFAYNLIII